MDNMIDVRELVGDDPLMAEIVAGFIELDDDGQKLILDLVELLNRRRKSVTPSSGSHTRARAR